MLTIIYRKRCINVQLQFIGAYAVGKYFYHIFLYKRYAVQYIKYSRRVKGRAFVFYHLLLAPQHWAQAARIPAAAALGFVKGAYIPCAVS